MAAKWQLHVPAAANLGIGFKRQEKLGLVEVIYRQLLETLQ
jgi:hypothetical protein